MDEYFPQKYITFLFLRKWGLSLSQCPVFLTPTRSLESPNTHTISEDPHDLTLHITTPIGNCRPLWEALSLCLFPWVLVIIQ